LEAFPDFQCRLKVFAAFSSKQIQRTLQNDTNIMAMSLVALIVEEKKPILEITRYL